jgi:hypothetical protein
MQNRPTPTRYTNYLAILEGWIWGLSRAEQGLPQSVLILGEEKERGARGRHKRLLYCVSVKRTSLDHLLLGRKADVDRNVEWVEYSAGKCRDKVS